MAACFTHSQTGLDVAVLSSPLLCRTLAGRDLLAPGDRVGAQAKYGGAIPPWGLTRDGSLQGWRLPRARLALSDSLTQWTCRRPQDGHSALQEIQFKMSLRVQPSRLFLSDVRHTCMHSRLPRAPTVVVPSPKPSRVGRG